MDVGSRPNLQIGYWLSVIGGWSAFFQKGRFGIMKLAQVSMTIEVSEAGEVYRHEKTCPYTAITQLISQRL